MTLPSRWKELRQRLKDVDVDQLAQRMEVGPLLLHDIVDSLERPDRDPRDVFSPPLFRREILKLEDLKPGMKLAGTVLNVVDFGAFVDIGIVDSGLVHVSRLADRFVRDPHEVVSVGDLIDVWVVEVDQQRRRVSLTAIPPGTQRPKPPRAPSRPPKKRRPRPAPPTAAPTPPPRPRPPRRPKPAPRPVVPITKEMEEGREPMRTFGDLKQYFDKKKTHGGRPPDEPTAENGQ